MKLKLKEPMAVKEARESKKGLRISLEILIFVAVFFVCTFAETIVMVPAQMIMMFTNAGYLDAIASGDQQRIEDVTLEVAMEISSSGTMMLVSLFATIFMILVVFLFCKLVQKRKLSSLGFTKKGAGIDYLKGAAVGFVMFSAAVLLCVITGALKIDGISEDFALPVFLLFTIGFLFQGMAEEVLCRGYFMVSLGRRYSMTVAVLVNSAAFAALHLFNPGIGVLPILNIMLFGIFASICFIKTENIWMIGAIHSVWNLVQGNVYGIRVSGMDTGCTILSSTLTEGKNIINGGVFGLEGGIAVTIVLVVAIAIISCSFKNDMLECQ